MTAIPGDPSSPALTEVGEAEPSEAEPYVMQTLLVGLCGTDRELLARRTESSDRIIIGHESLARVIVAPPSGPLSVGDRVVGVIRGPCLASCAACIRGRFDLCSSNNVVERGIHLQDGFGTDRWTAAESSLVPVPAQLGDEAVLTEPLTSLVKARRRLGSVLGSRKPERLLVAGAGPIGLLAAFLFGQDFDEVVVVDPLSNPNAVAAVSSLPSTKLTASWPTHGEGDFDVFIECSGRTEAVNDGIGLLAHGGVGILEGICSSSAMPLPAAALQRMTMRDLSVFGTVNASRADHLKAVEMLCSAPVGFLQSLVTAEISPSDWPAWARAEASSGIKTVVRFYK